jgi:sec-independent protein translocase protein TatA
LGSIGGPEILLVLVIALLLFGPKKLPELGKSVGRALREFKRASQELRDTLEREVEDIKRETDETPSRERPKGALPPPTGPVPAPPPAPVLEPAVGEAKTTASAEGEGTASQKPEEPA